MLKALKAKKISPDVSSMARSDIFRSMHKNRGKADIAKHKEKVMPDCVCMSV